MSDYFSPESEKKYMSNHQFNDWKFCEAMAYAKYVTFEYKPEMSEAFVMGLWVESLIQGHEYDHPSMYAKKGNLLANFEHGKTMAKKAKDDKFFMFVCQGEPQMELYGEISGTPWKCKLDYCDLTRRWVTDLKTAKSFQDDWLYVDGKNTKVPWYEIHNYWRQMAIQKELARQNFGFGFEAYIAAVTKQDPPDIDVIHFADEARFRLEMIVIDSKMERINDIKTGAMPATRCEHCEYCRATKKLTKPRKAVSCYGK